MNDYLIDLEILSQDLIDLLKAVRDHAIAVEEGEKRCHLTDDELVIAAWRYQDNCWPKYADEDPEELLDGELMAELVSKLDPSQKEIAAWCYQDKSPPEKKEKK